MKKKVIMAVFLIGILLIVGFSVYGLNKFFNSPEMLTKKYSEELGDIISLEEKQKVIRVIKDYIDNDDIEDYVVLYGTEKYSDVSAVEGAAPNLEMYSNVGIQYINGENTEIIKYDTAKTFDVNVEMSVEVNSDINYIFISDANSGNVCLLKLNEDKTFTDLVKESLGDEPKGYMISSTWDTTTNTSKLKIKLDKGDISYLPEKTDEYILDYTNTKVNQTSYRQKYVMNKFNYFIVDEAKIEKDSKKTETKDENVTNTISQNEVQNIEDNVVTDTSKTESNKNSDTKKLQIIGVQNILYLNATSSDVKVIIDNGEYFDECDLDIMDWMRQFSEDKRESYLRTFLGRMLFTNDDVYKAVKVLSGGEKVRCMLSKLMLSGASVLMLDQPTNHLDLESVAALNNGMTEFKGNIIFSTHDHQMTQTVANRIIEFNDDGSITDRRVTYDEYIEMMKAKAE